eukprot:7030618-Ditylum_brightwellii.AAC.1
MMLDYTQTGALKLDMKDNIKEMLEDFPYEIKKTTKAQWTEKLFKVDYTSKKLNEEQRGVFHTIAMKMMFICKRGRPDINPG